MRLSRCYLYIPPKQYIQCCAWMADRAPLFLLRQKGAPFSARKKCVAMKQLSTARRTLKNSDINAPGTTVSGFKQKIEGTYHLPAFARAGITRISRSFPGARFRAWGGFGPLNNRLCRLEQANLFDGICAMARFCANGSISEKVQWQRYFQSARTLAQRGFASRWCPARHWY